ncbi:hypothetical protein LA76x_2763 [Lysobacter antibioticus]|uniref:Uncharacterized protein n=1 Tax=Lysobacter antibioticus TaxID=84531 RepID=A0A0S2FBS2_LYSAN|nr:hypothetical protein LA76x_2763 [Lysobacter antibioticus]
MRAVFHAPQDHRSAVAACAAPTLLGGGHDALISRRLRLELR